MQLTAKQIQEKLNVFYLDAIESLRAAGALRPEQVAVLSAPFLLNVLAGKAYFDAPVRIMFVRQETKGWLCRLPEVFNDPVGRMHSLLARYETSLLADPGHSHFLRARSHLERELATHHRTPSASALLTSA